MAQRRSGGSSSATDQNTAASPSEPADADVQTAAIVLPEYEDRITRAANSGDNAEVARVQAEYDKARNDEYKRRQKEDN